LGVPWVSEVELEAGSTSVWFEDVDDGTGIAIPMRALAALCYKQGNKHPDKRTRMAPDELLLAVY
jgi:hypothetical protein